MALTVLTEWGLGQR